MSEKLYNIDSRNKLHVYDTVTDSRGNITEITGRHYELIEDESTKSGLRWVRRPDRTLYYNVLQEWSFYYKYEGKKTYDNSELEIRIRFWDTDTSYRTAKSQADYAMWQKNIFVDDNWDTGKKKAERVIQRGYYTDKKTDADYIIFDIEHGERFWASWESGTLIGDRESAQEEFDDNV